MISEHPPATATIRLLCVDDHRLMREGIIRILTTYPDVVVVAQATDGREAIEQYHQHRPDVTLMDLQLPKMHGLEALRQIRSSDPQARIVVLTMYQGDEDIYRALQAGAVGYVLKDAVPEELIHVIREAHAGRQAIPADVAARLDTRANQPSLTNRELQVLQLLKAGRRNKEISAELGISEDTTRTHIKSIFQKFNVHDRTAALTEAFRRGFVHID